MNIKGIIDVIKDPVHGEKFYTRENLKDLIISVKEICENIEIDKNTSHENIISIVNNYIKQNVRLRNSYFDTFCEITEKFDRHELIYRTAYGALVKGEAMCAGHTEALRVILAQYDIKTYTVLTKLPGSNKRLLHYVAIAEYQKDGQTKCIVLDPERQANCEKKGMDYERYKSNMIYALPDSIFTNDVVGITGLGMEAEEYLSHEEIFRIQGIDQLSKLVEKIKENTFNKEYDSRKNTEGENGDGENSKY